MRRLHLLTIIPTVLVALLLAGCGGEDAPSDDPNASDSGGEDSGDSDETAEVPDVCAVFDAAAAGDVLGAPLTAEAGPMDTCEYDQEDPRATSFSLGAIAVADLGGGAETYFDGLSMSVDIDGETTPDVGEQARIVSGSTSGFSQTAGAAVADGVLYTVNLIPGSDLDTAGELALAEKLLAALVEAV